MSHAHTQKPPLHDSVSTATTARTAFTKAKSSRKKTGAARRRRAPSGPTTFAPTLKTSAPITTTLPGRLIPRLCRNSLSSNAYEPAETSTCAGKDKRHGLRVLRVRLPRMATRCDATCAGRERNVGAGIGVCEQGVCASTGHFSAGAVYAATAERIGSHFVGGEVHYCTTAHV